MHFTLFTELNAYHSQFEEVSLRQSTSMNTPPVQTYYSPPISSLSSNGCPTPPLQTAGPIKQDGAPSSSWHSSSQSLNVLLQQTNLAVDALHPSIQNGSALQFGQENGVTWTSQKDGNIYRGYDVTSSQGSMSSSSPVSQQDMLNVSSSHPIHSMNVATANSISMEMEDVRCSSVSLEKTSFIQALNPSNNRRQVQHPSQLGTSAVAASSSSFSSMTNSFEPMHHNFLNETSSSNNPGLQNPINNQYFSMYSTQEDDFLNTFGRGFDDML